jgi:hypothetical protein
MSLECSLGALAPSSYENQNFVFGANGVMTLIGGFLNWQQILRGMAWKASGVSVRRSVKMPPNSPTVATSR